MTKTANDLPPTVGAGPRDDDIIVTPAMIEAGRDAIGRRWAEFTSVEGHGLLDEVLCETFLAMSAKRHQ
jgi:hypothetical protein